jgi:chorismate mutase/prephenate dehydratase
VELKKSLGTIKISEDGGNIAFLGPEGTFSYQAAVNIFPKKFDLADAPTITEVFNAVMEEKAIFGVVPGENSTEGMIGETVDNLIDYPLKVVGSYDMPIHLNLLARTDDVKKIKVIKSHAQPIAQARNWLGKNLPDVTFEIEPSSTKAILSTKDPEVAFISSAHAAKKYNLKILAENIEDKKTNYTQFFIIAKKDSPELSKILEASRTLVILAVYDRVGVLRDILNHFSDKKLNLTKLHSKKTEAEGWDYYFYIEINALPSDKRVKKALKEIKRHCSIVRVLGVT